MEYYAYWNGDQIVAILNAIAGITNSQSFTGLLRVAGVFGLMAAVIGAMFRQKFADAWNFFLVFTLIYMGLVVPKVTVNVIDVRGGTAVPVANVPLGVGVFGSEMSHIGKWLTETYETAFSPADDVARFGRFGILGPQRLLNAAINASLDVPVVRSNLSNLMKDCVIPELIDQPQMVAQFGASADIWALIGSSGGGAPWLNPARLTMVQAPPAAGTPSDIIRGTGVVEATPQTCPDAYNVINGQMTLAVNVAINTIAARELPLNSGQSQTPASPGALAAAGTYIKARIEGANALLTGVASTTEQIIKQRATMDALSNGIDASNPMAASVGQAVGVGNLSSAINYRAMPQIAQDALPKLRNSVEMLVIAAFPIMVVMLLVSGLQGLPLFKGYLVMMLWTQLWAPLYAVVNFMMITSDTSPYTALINAYGAQSVAAMSLITQLGASSQDTAGMLALAIPVIALALAKGGEMALTSMASTVMSPATSAAQSSGSQLAQGNSSLGNVSWGNLTEGNVSRSNYSANQVRSGSNIDTSSSIRSGDGGATSVMGASGTRTTDGTGGEVFNVPQSQTGSIGGSVTGSNTLGNGATSAQGATATQGKRAEISRELGNALRDATGAQTSREFNQAFQAAWRQTTSGEDGVRGVTSQSVQSGAMLESGAAATERLTMGGGVRTESRGAGGMPGPGRGPSGTPATTGSKGVSAGSPAAAGSTSPSSGTAGPPLTTRSGSPVPAPTSRESQIPPDMRGDSAPLRPTVDPNSPKAQVPPGQRIDGYQTGVPQSSTAEQNLPTGGMQPSQGGGPAGSPVGDAAGSLAGLATNMPAKPFYGGSADAATAITDAARRTMQGNGTQQDERILAAASQAARSMAYDSGDRSTQQIGKRLEAALNSAVASRGSSTASAETSSRAESTRTEGSTNQAQASRDLKHDLPAQMRAMFPEKYTGFGGDQRMAQDMQRGAPEAQAAMAALQSAESSNLGATHPSGATLARPQEPGAVYAGGLAAVAATTKAGDAQARAANAGALETVRGTMPGVEPTSTASPNGVPGAVNSQVAGAQSAAADQGRDTATSAGMAQFSAAQFRSERASGTEPLKLALRTLGFGAGYHSPEETNAAMQSLRPYMSSEGQSFFEGLGRNATQNGGQISPAQLEQGMAYVKSAARARDEQAAPKGDGAPSYTAP